jgi:hypothetical protein
MSCSRGWGRTSTLSGCARPATLICYLSNDPHRLRMLPFVDDKSEDVGTYISQGLGHQSYSPTSDQALRNALEKTWSPRERAKMYALGCPARRASLRSRRPRMRLRGRRLRRDGGWNRAGDYILIVRANHVAWPVSLLPSHNSRHRRDARADKRRTTIAR